MTGKAGDMPPENDTSSTDDTSGQEQQEQQQQGPTPDTGGNGDQQQQEQQDQPVSKDAKLPDDHPVVKQLKADKDKLARANTELAELRVKSAQVTKLEEDLAARPTQEALDTLQGRYDRLEAFLQAAGGPISKALDSRSFTRSLFETTDDIKSIVEKWHKDNPSATDTALGTKGSAGGGGKVDPNELIRAAARGSSS